jgi:hypothetical protein
VGGDAPSTAEAGAGAGAAAQGGDAPSAAEAGAGAAAQGNGDVLMPDIARKEKGPAAGTKEKAMDGVPKWVIEGQKSLKITGSDGGGAEWILLTNLWYELEASTSFSTVSAF